MTDQYAHFEVFPGADGQHYWRLKSINGEIVAQSEGYESAAGAKRACHGVVDAVTAVNLQTAPHMAIAMLDSADATVNLGDRASGPVGGEHAVPPAPGEPGGPPADVTPPESTEGASAGKVETGATPDLGDPATPPASAEEVEEAEAAGDPPKE